MGKCREKTKTNSVAVDVVSLQSLDGLHGRVDFFGTESKKLYTLSNQKLKVVQTWVFLQAVTLVLLIAYTSLLGVWLYPFFPMNYADTAPDGSSITLSGLQSDVGKIEKTIGDTNGSVDYLHVWRKGHEETHVELNRELERLDGDTILSKLSKLEQKVSELSQKTEDQGQEITDLQLKVSGLESLVKTTKNQNIAKIDEHNIRITKLECAKGNLSSTIEQLINSTKNQFCDVLSNLGSAIGRVTTIERQISQEVTKDVGVLQQDVEHLKTTTTNTTQDLNKTIKRHIRFEKWTKDKFVEQDDLRGTALEKQRVLVFAKVGKLQCQMDDLSGSLHDRISHIMSNTTPSIENCFNEKIRVTQVYLEERISNLSKTLEDDIIGVERDLGETSQELKNSITAERKERTAQFVHVCDMVEEVNTNATNLFEDADWKILRNSNRIRQLTDSVSNLEKIEAENTKSIENLNGTQRRNVLQFKLFREETIHTELDLKNRTCTLESDVQAVTGLSNDLSTRLGIAEKTMQDLPLGVRSQVSLASAQTTESMVKLQSDADALRSDLIATTEQLGQFARDLGFSSLGGLQESLRTVSSNTASAAALQDDPEMTPMMDPEYLEEYEYKEEER